MRDAVAGEEQIKQAQTKYLAKSAGMIEAEKQGDTAGEIYKAYLSRAQYPLWVQDSLRTMIGLVSKLDPNIVIESTLLQGLITNATNDGFGLKQLFIRICLELLEYGRCGLLVDVDAKGVPYFALYDALSIINWKENSIGGRKDLKLLVLEEQFDNSEDEFGHNTKTSEATADIAFLAQSQFSLDENGKAVAIDANGEVVIGKDGSNPVTPKEWVEGLRENKPYFWPKANGSGSPGSGTSIKKWSDYTEVERAALARENPTAFQQLLQTKGK